MSKRIAFLVAGLALLLPVPNAAAGEVPAFLANGQKYATEPAACSDDMGETNGLNLSKVGMFGYEFGCVFADFLPVRGGDGEVYQHIAVAACGDDSGISRPDLIMLIPSENDSVYVTSQNDFAATTALRDSDSEGIAQKEFVRCTN